MYEARDAHFVRIFIVAIDNVEGADHKLAHALAEQGACGSRNIPGSCGGHDFKQIERPENTRQHAIGFTNEHVLLETFGKKNSSHGRRAPP